jgi:hypothetical protein
MSFDIALQTRSGFDIDFGGLAPPEVPTTRWVAFFQLF